MKAEISEEIEEGENERERERGDKGAGVGSTGEKREMKEGFGALGF